MLVSARRSRADLFKTSIRLSAKGVKYGDKSRRVWGVYNCKIIQMIDNLCKMCVLYSRYKLNFKNEGTFTFLKLVVCSRTSGDALVIFLLDY
mgnify:CR=1 FL=1